MTSSNIEHVYKISQANSMKNGYNISVGKRFGSHATNNLYYFDKSNDATPADQIRVLENETASTLNNIAINFLGDRNYTQAEHFLLQALKAEEEYNGKLSQEYGMYLNNLGELHLSKGDPLKALSIFREVESNYKLTIGTENNNYATLLINISEAYSDVGDFISAKHKLIKAFDLQKKVLESNHPDIGITMNNIGILYQRLGKLPLAMDYFCNALKIYEKHFPNDHPMKSLIKNNMAFFKEVKKKL
jgi:tetratricopeptide (TPR) repeat protein